MAVNNGSFPDGGKRRAHVKRVVDDFLDETLKFVSIHEDRA
jgi:hypothetical protein